MRREYNFANFGLLSTLRKPTAQEMYSIKGFVVAEKLEVTLTIVLNCLLFPGE